MEKNAIKKFAVWARRELIERVSQKAMQYGIEKDTIVDATADSINGKLLTDTQKKQRKTLISQIKTKGYEEVMEEVAYTWFNRLIALRFMEVNGSFLLMFVCSQMKKIILNRKLLMKPYT